jgi:hypothetical protein
MELHKDFIKTGDTVLINDKEFTVTSSDIKLDPLMGTLRDRLILISIKLYFTHAGIRGNLWDMLEVSKFNQ